MKKTLYILSILTLVAAGCSSYTAEKPNGTVQEQNNPAPQSQKGNPKPEEPEKNTDKKTDEKGSNQAQKPQQETNKPEDKPEDKPQTVQEVVTDPFHIAVLVNKQYALPDDYKPDDLVYPDVHFIFSEKIEKRMLRKEAAKALEDMFAGAAKDGIHLGGVSGYRSQSTQKSLFDRYAKRDGEEKAKMYSALPRHSEHETGLAIDVSGSDGKCAAQDCFGGTKEAVWLEEHSAEYGFIIRYPKDKESITGYQYEPWHLRYVGTDLAKELWEQDQTLEEYYQVVPVSQ